MNQFYPQQTITITPSGVINPNRFVDLGGAQAGAGEAARGITHDGAIAGERAVPVIVLGTAVIEAGDAFDAGVNLSSDAQGRAVLATGASDYAINAISVEASTAAGDFVEVIVVPPIVRATMIRAAAQVNSVAVDAAGIVVDFNALLEKLRTAGILTQ